MAHFFEDLGAGAGLGPAAAFGAAFLPFFPLLLSTPVLLMAEEAGVWAAARAASGSSSSSFLVCDEGGTLTAAGPLPASVSPARTSSCSLAPVAAGAGAETTSGSSKMGAVRGLRGDDAASPLAGVFFRPLRSGKSTRSWRLA